MARRAWIADDGSEHETLAAAKLHDAVVEIGQWVCHAVGAETWSAPAYDRLREAIEADPRGFTEVVRPLMRMRKPAPLKNRFGRPPTWRIDGRSIYDWAQAHGYRSRQVRYALRKTYGKEGRAFTGAEAERALAGDSHA